MSIVVVMLVTQSCPTLWDPTDCSLPKSSIHGILQARILEWVAISFSRGSSPDPGTEPRSPVLQTDSLPSELQFWQKERTNSGLILGTQMGSLRNLGMNSLAPVTPQAAPWHSRLTSVHIDVCLVCNRKFALAGLRGIHLSRESAWPMKPLPPLPS